MQIRIQIQIFLTGKVFVQTKFLRHIAKLILYALRVFGYVSVQYSQSSFCGTQKTTDQTDESGFAGSVRSDQRRQFPFFYFRGNIMQSENIFFGNFIRKALSEIFRCDDPGGIVHRNLPLSYIVLIVLKNSGRFSGKGNRCRHTHPQPIFIVIHINPNLIDK